MKLAFLLLSVIALLAFVARRWGVTAAKKDQLEDNIDAAKKRKEVDDEVQKLTSGELADALRNGL